MEEIPVIQIVSCINADVEPARVVLWCILNDEYLFL